MTMDLRTSKYADFGSIRELIKRRFPSILPLKNLDPLLLDGCRAAAACRGTGRQVRH